MEGKNIWSTGEIKNGDRKGKNIRRRKTFSQRRRRKTEKEKNETVWRREIFSAEEEVEIFYLKCTLLSNLLGFVNGREDTAL